MKQTLEASQSIEPGTLEMNAFLRLHPDHAPALHMEVCIYSRDK